MGGKGEVMCRSTVSTYRIVVGVLTATNTKKKREAGKGKGKWRMEMRYEL